MRKSRGFTLVELLVVIGIIALLISILLPSLARARQYALNVQCQANLRSVGQGFLFYANDHKGKLPYGGNGDWAHIWPVQVSVMLGSEMPPVPGDIWGNVTGTYAPVLRCPEAPIEGSAVAWNGGFHYTGNVRALPARDQADGNHRERVVSGTPYAIPYPLATKDSSSKCLMWDGPIMTDGAPWGTPDGPWSAPGNNVPQSWWYITWGNNDCPCWSDPNNAPWQDLNAPVGPAGDPSFVDTNPNSATWMGLVNHDGGPGDSPWSGNNFGFERYRHLGNTSCNFLFFDGHVEAKKMGELTYGNLSIFPY